MGMSETPEGLQKQIKKALEKRTLLGDGESCTIERELMRSKLYAAKIR